MPKIAKILKLRKHTKEMSYISYVLSAQINTPDERSVAQRTSYSADGFVTRRTCVACEEDPLPAISPPAGKDSAIGEKRFISRRATNLSHSVIRMRGRRRGGHPEEIPSREIICLGIQAEFVSSRRKVAPYPPPDRSRPSNIPGP